MVDMNRFLEKRLQITLVITSLVMIVLRFLLNEKGRVSPDSIRFMRSARLFPTIDNTTAPLGYPLAIKLLTVFGLHEFWASKVIGILAFLFILFFAWKKKFYFKEMVLIVGLVSYVSVFSFTLSETLILPFVFLLLYVSRNSIVGIYSSQQIFWQMSISLVLLYNIRYSALFFILGVGLFGLLYWKKHYGKAFVAAASVGLFYVFLYKILFIDYFNESYVNQFLEIGLHSFPKLAVEFFQGLTTTFNPFIHIANPGGGIINYFIYGIGFLVIMTMFLLFSQNTLSETEKYFLFIGCVGIVCSFFIQFFYSVDALDYRLLSPFVLSVWMVFFKKLYSIFGRKTYAITILSLLSCFAFSWLSRGDFLENRKVMTRFLQKENLLHSPIYYYTDAIEEVPQQIQVVEMMSTINPLVYIVHYPKDTLQARVLTEYKVRSKIKIIKNKYQ